jgi:hypothetical protein
MSGQEMAKTEQHGPISYPPISTKTEYRIRFSLETPDLAWDSFVARTHGGRHFQSSLWAQVKSVVGWRTARVVVSKNGAIVAGAQILMRRIPYLGAVGYVSRGPLACADDAELRDLVISGLLQIIEEQRIKYLLVQPPCHGEVFAERLECWGFKPNPSVRVAPTATAVINLAKGLDDVLTRMTARSRRYIRAALRSGVTVREGNGSDVPAFYRMLQATASRKNWMIFPEDYYARMWRILSPGNHVRLTFAECQGKIVSAMLVYAFGEGVYGKTIFSINHGGSLGTKELLVWDALQWANSQGHIYFDLGIVDPQVARAVSCAGLSHDQLGPGPALFKFRLGGQAVFCPEAYVYIGKPILRWVYSVFFPLIYSSAIGETLRMTVRGFRHRVT